MADTGMKKATSSEDEYFVREDAEKKRKLALELKKQTAAAEQQRLKELHFMHCPKCGMKMQEIRYGAIDVDACFSCGGVFLDKGEIDVIAHPQQKGIMSAILNWFKDETRSPVK
jgi:uncharacterized protein